MRSGECAKLCLARLGPRNAAPRRGSRGPFRHHRPMHNSPLQATQPAFIAWLRPDTMSSDPSTGDAAADGEGVSPQHCAKAVLVVECTAPSRRSFDLGRHDPPCNLSRTPFRATSSPPSHLPALRTTFSSPHHMQFSAEQLLAQLAAVQAAAGAQGGSKDSIDPLTQAILERLNREVARVYAEASGEDDGAGDGSGMGGDAGGSPAKSTTSTRLDASGVHASRPRPVDLWRAAHEVDRAPKEVRHA
jgi:hypothetical protein